MICQLHPASRFCFILFVEVRLLPYEACPYAIGWTSMSSIQKEERSKSIYLCQTAKSIKPCTWKDVRVCKFIYSASYNKANPINFFGGAY